MLNNAILFIGTQIPLVFYNKTPNIIDYSLKNTQLTNKILKNHSNNNITQDQCIFTCKKTLYYIGHPITATHCNAAECLP